MMIRDSRTAPGDGYLALITRSAPRFLAALVTLALAAACEPDRGGEVGAYAPDTARGRSSNGADSDPVIASDDSDSGRALDSPDGVTTKAATGEPSSGRMLAGEAAIGAQPAAGAFEWPFFGLDADNSRNNRAERTLSIDNVAQLKPLWIKELSGGMHGIPALVGGTLYVGDHDNLYALDPRSGDELWTTRVGTIASSPLVTSDAVYVAADRSLFAFDRMNGLQRWSLVLDEHEATALLSSPVLADGVIVIGVASNEDVRSKADYTFVGSVKGVDPDNGQQLWSLPLAGDDGVEGASGNGVSVWSSAAVDKQLKLAFIGTGNSYEAPASTLSDSLLAIDYATGTVTWSKQFASDDVYVSAQCPSANCEEDFDIGASPNLFMANGVAAVGVGSKGGIFSVMQRDTGDVIWSRDFSAETGRGAAGGIMTTAAVGDRIIYTNSNAWVEHGFRRNGQHDPADTSTTYALDIGTGESIWQQPMPAPAIGMVMLANGVLYQGLINGEVYALHAETGEVLWSADTGHDLMTGFSLADGVLYGGSGGNWFSASLRPGASVMAFGLDP
jgi:polyvinyl alcohol dehydrogenase (cytochrome)